MLHDFAEALTLKVRCTRPLQSASRAQGYRRNLLIMDLEGDIAPYTGHASNPEVSRLISRARFLAKRFDQSTNPETMLGAQTHYAETMDELRTWAAIKAKAAEVDRKTRAPKREWTYDTPPVLEDPYARKLPMRHRPWARLPGVATQLPPLERPPIVASKTLAQIEYEQAYDEAMQSAYLGGEYSKPLNKFQY